MCLEKCEYQSKKDICLRCATHHINRHGLIYFDLLPLMIDVILGGMRLQYMYRNVFCY